MENPWAEQEKNDLEIRKMVTGTALSESERDTYRTMILLGLFLCQPMSLWLWLLGSRDEEILRAEEYSPNWQIALLPNTLCYALILIPYLFTGKMNALTFQATFPFMVAFGVSFTIWSYFKVSVRGAIASGVIFLAGPIIAKVFIG